jgi:hypothetical protein
LVSGLGLGRTITVELVRLVLQNIRSSGGVG